MNGGALLVCFNPFGSALKHTAVGCQQHCGANLTWLVAPGSLIQQSPIQERIQPHETRRFWNSLSLLLFISLFIASPSLCFSVPRSSERCCIGFSSRPIPLGHNSSGL